MKTLAFYLPQFHPVKENSEWWGSGFTEWHNVAKARPLYKGHAQPNLPGELGFYDLRLEETRIEQARLAAGAGITGFCYWHYWFDGRRILERPAAEMLASKEPNFPFCLAWANETWTGVWHGSPNKILLEQTYSCDDARRHYETLSPFFKDSRYIKIKNSPLFYVYKPNQIPGHIEYIAILREMAKADGFDDLYVVGTWSPNPRGRISNIRTSNLDAVVITNITGRDSASILSYWDSAIEKVRHKMGVELGPRKIDYELAIEAMLPDLNEFGQKAFNCVVANWDNTPRSGRKGLVFTDSTPEKFERAMKKAVANTEKSTFLGPDESFIFLKSWNEWAEGNYLEPDQKNGRKYLDVLARVLRK